MKERNSKTFPVEEEVELWFGSRSTCYNSQELESLDTDNLLFAKLSPLRIGSQRRCYNSLFQLKVCSLNYYTLALERQHSRNNGNESPDQSTTLCAI